MEDMTFAEQLAALREVAESPDETLWAVERVEMFTQLFKQLYKTLAPTTGTLTRFINHWSKSSCASGWRTDHD